MPGSSDDQRPEGAEWEGAPRARITGVGLMLGLLFLAGLGCRLTIFSRAHSEGDEIIYRVLVDRVARGGDYTLAGTPLVGSALPASQYGQALFFHPPGGVALFLALRTAFGAAGFPLAQLLSYALFFAGMLALFRAIAPDASTVARLVVGALAAFTPILSHVTVHYWLDGPLLALATVAAATHAHASRRGSLGLAVLAGVALGAATWMKASAIVAAPGIVFLGFALCPAGMPFARRCLLPAALIATTLLVHAPWLAWQWHVLGTPFPAWAGKPAPELVAKNPYLHYLTWQRSPWIYVTWLPRVLWTLVPSLIGLCVLSFGRADRRVGWLLWVWIAVVVLVHVQLGYMGYSKVLRYVITVTPAAVVLCAWVADRAWIATRASGKRASLAWCVLALVAAGLVLEVAQGITTAFFHQDLIVPLFHPTS